MTFDDFKALCKERRSIRYFDKRPVSDDDILKLLEIARLAPSVENLQPWHFHVVRNPQMLHTMMEASCYGNFVEGAGVFIVVSCDKSLMNKAPEPVWNHKELEYSCMSAMEHLLLGAAAMGLGSCWVSLHHGAVHESLGLPLHKMIVGGVMIGHYKPEEEKGNDSHQRKNLEEIYTFHD